MRWAWLLVVAMVMTTAPAAVSVQTPADLEHDLENGCGPAHGDFVPDNSAVLRLIFGDLTAIPEVVQWAIDQDSVDYFSAACFVHDRCYGTPGMSKSDCDLAMLSDLAGICREVYLSPEIDWWDVVTLGATFVIDTVWEAIQYLPCVTYAATTMYAAVGIFAGSAYSEAQEQALEAATCSPVRPQASLGGVVLPAPAIQAVWASNCGLVDIAFGGGRWSGIARGDRPAQTVVPLSDLSQLIPMVQTELTAGRALVSLEYGDGWWLALFSGGTGTTSSFTSIRTDLAAVGTDIQQSVWQAGLEVTVLEYGDGLWFLYGRNGSGITEQQYFTDVGGQGLSDLIQQQYDAGWVLTGLEFDGYLWTVMFSKGMPWRQTGVYWAESYHDLRVWFDGQAAAGKFVHEIEYGDLGWAAIWFEPMAETVAVPDLLGMSRVQAIDAIHALDLGVAFGEPSRVGNDFRHLADTVYWQDPRAGTLVEPGSTVTIRYYEWALMVPDWVGSTVLEAQSEAAGLGLSVTEGTFELLPPGDPNLGRITATSPAAGTEVEVGTTVIATIGVPSLVEVPDLAGYPEATAREVVEDGSLVFEIAGYVDAGPEWVGRVVDQDPMPYGDLVPYGSVVRVWLGAEESTTTSY